MTFVAPQFLWLLLAVPAVWIWPRGNAAAAAHRLVRTLTAVALVVALARPVARVDETIEYHALIWDRSPSVARVEPTFGREAVASWTRALPEGAVVEVVAIGAALADRDREALGDARAVRRLPEGSDLSAALEIASQHVPDRARGAVTIISDGASTRRDWGAPVVGLIERGIPVHALATFPADREVRPVAMSAESPLRVGRVARIDVDLVGNDPAVDVVLFGRRSLDAPELELARVSDVRVAGTHRVTLSFEPELPGFLPLRVTVDPTSDLDPGDDTLERTFAVDDPIDLLYLGERIDGGAPALGRLLGRGFRIHDANDAESPGATIDTDRFDLALIDDRSAETLSSDAQRSIVEAVASSGLGLAMSGGLAAFGPGGYHDTEIARALPVEFIQKEEKRDPSTTLVVIIDTSGSMGGNRVQLAKEVARLAIRRLLPHDKVGIVEFYGAKRWAAPIQPASNAIDLQRALNRLDAGGGTVILPAIEEAFYALQNVETRYKHVLVLTDGGVETGPFESLLRRMAEKGITVST
ncbi:MAG: VWA domain-containing protein, partial [Planctomycetes bacterium]|nr:VWA domain-containing protein [Planctomycetota bacterium]